MAVDVRTQPTIQVSRPRMLFERIDVTGFDAGRHDHVAPDGRLLLLDGDFVVVLARQDELEDGPGHTHGSR
jgi:hypothetical protein